MKSLRKLVLMLVLLLSISAINVYAEEAGVTGSIGTAVFYNYVWRGMLQHSGTAIQPDVNIGYSGLLLDVWSDFRTVSNVWHETDFTLSYSIQTLPEFLYITLGAIAYTVTGLNEVYDGYVTIGFKTFADISLTGYAGNSEGNNGSVFTILHVLHSFELAKDFTFDPCLAFATNYVKIPYRNYYGEIAVPLNYTFSKHLTVGATYVLDVGNKMVNRTDGVISYGGAYITASL
ncbi:MAG: hypothetical protein HQK91_01795 [Nitrospirae bacterium]|nr:hypothetical protein [Nitrospirota bacterium]MBF0540167.1 hypothetical protein [Nitrospirota bacterium]